MNTSKLRPRVPRRAAQRDATSRITSLKSSFWKPSDQLLVEAGASGELLVARIRLLLTAILLLIPIITVWRTPDKLENMVGFGVTLGASFLSIILYFLVSKEINRPWLGFVSSAFDVTLVSGALIVFLIFNTPHTAVNSKVIFEGYFIAIGATTLRYDARICAVAGLLAVCEYAGIVSYAANTWNLNDPVYAPFAYGMFDWNAQISRLIMMLTASVLSTAVVLRLQRLRLLSTSDRLTGLFNRGFFDERVAAEVTRAARYNHPLAIAMIDVDHFKPFNDTHGHTVGDLALCVIASKIRSSFRSSDIVARYGGEEFVVIMPETNTNLAIEKLEKLRQEIASTPITLTEEGATAGLTISAGVSCFPADGSRWDDLLNVADGRLFEAKKRGRNQTVGN